MYTSYRNITLAGIGITAMAVALGVFAPAAIAQEVDESAGNGAEVVSQNAPVAEEEDVATMSRVVVSGSRVVRDGSQAPTPVTVVQTAELKAVAPQNLAEGLNQLPMFRNSVQPSTAGVASTSGLNGANYLNLRGLGPNRTLVLLDGRRVTPSSNSGATNVDLFPQDLVQRVDVVTGGASAAYGSDAVAGVVNFILDSRYEGTKAELKAGISQQSDAESFGASLTHGREVLGGRGHIVLSAEYYDSEGIDNPEDRSWGARGPGVYGAGPQYTLGTGMRMPNATFGGLVTSVSGLAPGATPPTINGIPLICRTGTGFTPCLEFGPGGAPDPFDIGTFAGGTFSIGGDGARLGHNLSASLERKTAFARFTFDANADTELFVEASYGEGNTRYSQLYPFQIVGRSGFTIFPDNAFLDADVRDALAASSITSLQVSRISRDFDYNYSDNTNETWRVAAGLEGQLSERWSYDVYAAIGKSNGLLKTDGNTIHRNLYEAADAVIDPVSGDIVCRSTLTNPGNGCVPLNIFGEGSPSQAAIDYVTGTGWADVTLKQNIVGANLRGTLFSWAAGDVNMAVGAEYRDESGDQKVDPISRSVVSAATDSGVPIRGIPAGLTGNGGALGGFSFTNPQPVSGEINVAEAYLEADVPLIKDQPLAKSLSLNGAVRYTDYSTSGGVTTWKLGTVYEPVTDLRFRVTGSRDIRAPNISELFRGSIQSQGTLNDPFNGNALVGYRGSSAGNPDLAPEEADTFAYGFVYQPSWLSGASLTVDGYEIEIANAVGTVGPQFVVDQCFNFQQLCNFVARDDLGNLRITTTSVNLASAKTKGVDIELGYRASLDEVLPAIGGDLSIRGIASYLYERTETAPGSTEIDRAGDILSGYPEWQGNLVLNWSKGNFSTTLQGRFIGSGEYDVTSGTNLSPFVFTPNDVDAVTYVDATVRYEFERFGAENELFLTVNNLLDRDPPLIPSRNSYSAYTNAALYNVMGRYFMAGLRTSF